MICKISCSFGEVIDKVTILRIKLKKIKDETALKNIKLELSKIQYDNTLINKSDKLFDDLYTINCKLWILEDLIREKSKKKEFDDKYIEYAECIHKTNDERFSIKNKINNKYNSEIKEEKSFIYNPKTSIKSQKQLNNKDLQKLDKGKRMFSEGNYHESYKIINIVFY